MLELGRSSTKSIAPFAPDSNAGWRRRRFARTKRTMPRRAAASGSRALAGGGWLRACVPGPYGGIRAELDVRTLCLARERLAYRSALADFAFAMQGLGGGPVALFGNAELKRRYLPEIAAGRCIAAFALSELEAGSDVAALATTATRRNGEYVLEGEKTWISNAGIADLYVVFARTGERGAKGLSAFAVDATAAGLRAEGNIETISPHPLGTLKLRRRRRSRVVPHRRRGRGLQGCDERARRLSQHGRRGGQRLRAPRARRIGRARQAAAALRRAAERAAADASRAREHGDRSSTPQRCSSIAPRGARIAARRA